MKTPKEKAKELYDRAEDYIYTSQAHYAEDYCEKNCALMAANEVRDCLLKNIAYPQCSIDLKYWDQVIKELNLL